MRFAASHFLWLGIVGLLLAACCRGAHGRGGSDEPGGNNKPVIYGTSACKGCHDVSKPVYDPQNPSICRLDEFKYWREDKHGIAFDVLKTERSARMGRVLQIDDVTRHPGCLSCHSVSIDPAKVVRDDSFHEEEGVSCVACHGADAGWLDRHGAATAVKRKQWRDMGRLVKDRQYGMTDLWDPAKRARLCVACHVGTATEQKVVTHAMYAAGHPPLPGVEIASFSDAMPRHWQYLKEKDDRIKALLHVSDVEAALERTNLVAVGALVSFEAGMRLLADQAKDGTAWPEFAPFDCYACHHDLQTKSWRIERGYTGKPGRPPLRAWPTTLVDLGIYHAVLGDSNSAAASSPDLRKRLMSLQKVLDERPFGKAAAVAPHAADLAEWAKQYTEIIGARANKLDRTASGRLLAELLRIEKQRIPDYDSARQIAWAFRVLQQETAPKSAASLEISPQWKALDKEMNLTFPRGREANVLNSLSYSLERISSYDPTAFRNNLDAVVKRFYGIEK
jgi:hypothetical protein